MTYKDVITDINKGEIVGAYMQLHFSPDSSVFYRVSANALKNIIKNSVKDKSIRLANKCIWLKTSDLEKTDKYFMQLNY